MAELIQCDRCDVTVNGRINPIEYNQGMGQMGHGYISKPSGPSVQGWEFVRGQKLFCPRCIADLEGFIAKPMAREAP